MPAMDNSGIDIMRLIAGEQAQCRSRFARQQVEKRRQEQERQTFSATHLGYDADSGVALSQTSNDGVLASEMITPNLIKQGQTTIVSIPSGSSKGFLDGLR